MIRLTLMAGILMAIMITAFAVGEPAVTQHSGAWGKGTYEKLYGGGKAAEVSGQVLSTGRFRAEEGAEPGVEVRLATDSGDYTVHLGPRWFVLENDLNFTRGEHLNIVGVKIQFQSKPVIVANQVVRKERTIIFREPATGRPRWLRTPGMGPTE